MLVGSCICQADAVLVKSSSIPLDECSNVTFQPTPQSCIEVFNPCMEDEYKPSV